MLQKPDDLFEPVIDLIAGSLGVLDEALGVGEFDTETGLMVSQSVNGSASAM